MNTIENNKLLAEFMGFKLQQNPNERWFGQYFTTPNGVWTNRIELLHFDTDWGWLMAVVEKIESIDFVVIIKQGECVIVNNSGNNPKFIQEVYTTKIEGVYNACVEFIKWYNNQK